MDVKLTKLGEGIESGNLVSVMAHVGDEVQKDQTLAEIETEKAVAPIVAPVAGKISKIHVKEGQKVSVGQLLFTLEAKEGASSPSSSPAAPKVTQPVSQTPRVVEPSSPRPDDFEYRSASGFPPPASPTVRQMARELGIDLTRVRGSGHGGRITLDDIKAYVRSQTASVSQTPSGRIADGKSIDFSVWGPVTKKPASTIRTKIAQKMHESWTTIPHVTQTAEADITSLLALIKKNGSRFESKGLKLTLTAALLPVILAALKKFPGVNASFDEATGEIIHKNYYHLGIAVDTEAGLIVPNLKNVDKKKFSELVKELAETAEKTRKRKIALEDIQGGTFTISNLGGIGGGFFTPIINKPEAAILGVGRGSVKPVWSGEKFEPRHLLPLSLSYDHRIIDGADGARFIVEIVKGLEQFDERWISD